MNRPKPTRKRSPHGKPGARATSSTAEKGLRILLALAAIGLFALAALAVGLVLVEEAPPAAGAATTPEPEGNPLKGSILVVAHRGRLVGMPENEIESVRVAFRGPDVDAVEVDVRTNGRGELVLAHDAPAPESAPYLYEAFEVLREPDVNPRRFLVLDLKGDHELANMAYKATPADLRDRVVYMVPGVYNSKQFRDAHPDARLWVNLPYHAQGTLLPKEWNVEAVVTNAGKMTHADLAAHLSHKTPLAIHAINSMARAHQLGLKAVIIDVGPSGRVSENLGEYHQPT
ncbi:MAG TPA: hypothetical protein VNZ52_02750 [Candidatus Thermoplasmatota archaeon]|nr:hypothetical protein [Candidatus Thermoplasmatota archaeon]